VKVKLGYKNFYAYTAVAPKEGDNFSLILPKVNTDCMNVYLEKMAEKYAGQEILFILDGAGWHKSKNLVIPKNIKIVVLPPYSPELNPVERLWQHIKDRVLKNRVYESLTDLEDAVSEHIGALNAQIIQSVCHISYLAHYL
jgi:transposase